MKLNFVKLNPSGNTTILILDPLPRSSYAFVASQVMKMGSLAAEQVGFIEVPANSEAVARLQMMGGEFCGNATRCFAAWLVERQYPGIIPHEKEGHWLVPLEISGYKGVLRAEVYQDNEKRISVKTPMPIPQRIQQYSVEGIGNKLTMVSFEGITHVIVWNVAPSVEIFRMIKGKIAKENKNHEKDVQAEALGVLFYHEEKQFLTPVVFVAGVNSLVWESSCGSGTVAVAAALAEKQKQSIDSLFVHQPGGTVGVRIKWHEKVVEAEIFGEVSLEAEGKVYIR